MRFSGGETQEVVWCRGWLESGEKGGEHETGVEVGKAGSVNVLFFRCLCSRCAFNNMSIVVAR